MTVLHAAPLSPWQAELVLNVQCLTKLGTFVTPANRGRLCASCKGWLPFTYALRLHVERFQLLL